MLLTDVLFLGVADDWTDDGPCTEAAAFKHAVTPISEATATASAEEHDEGSVARSTDSSQVTGQTISSEEESGTKATPVMDVSTPEPVASRPSATVRALRFMRD